MKITDSEKNWITSRLIFEVEDGDRRSDIQLAARSLSNDSDDPENAYWLLVNHFLDPENDADFKKASEGVDPVSLFEENTDYKPKSKRSGGKRTKK